MRRPVIWNLLLKAQFQIGVRIPPDKWQASHPIFSVDGFTRVSVFLRRKNPCRGGKLGAGHFAADAAGSEAHLRVVANTLRLAHIAARHYVELVAVFSKPNWRRDLFPILAERG